MMRARPLSIAAAILAVSVLFWLASANDDWGTSFSVSGKQTDYYNLLVHGFQKGHLYMDSAPDPALWSTEPAVRSQAAYLLDASLYNHRYYLYYGVVPAVLLLLPYSSLTGGELSANVVTLICVVAGFLFSLRAYQRARREYFDGIGSVLDSLNVLLLGFATLGPVLVKCSGVYEVAESSGYCCCAAATYFLYRFLHSGQGGIRWMAAASLALGLAVGCRPDYFLSLPILVAAVWLTKSGRLGLAGTNEAEGAKWWSGYGLAAAVLPAAAVVGLLGAYNYARFGNPLEFGFHYGMNAFTGTGRPVASVRFIWPNLRWYYLTPPVLSAYFPFVSSIDASALPPGYYSPEAIHGQFVVVLLAAAAGVGAVAARLRFGPADRRVWLYLCLLGWVAAIGIAFSIPLCVRADRYMADFQPSLILLVAISSGLVASKCGRDGALSSIWRVAYGAVALAAILFNFLISLEIFNNFEYLHPRMYRRLSEIGDLPIYELGEHGFVDYGPAKFTLVFPVGKVNMTGPLIATGPPNHTDILDAIQYSSEEMEFEIVHELHVGLRSGRLPLVTGHPYTVEVDMGSFYPPRFSPYFKGWDEKDIDRLKTTARVLLDGKEVLRGRMAFYDSSPGMVHFGENPGEDKARFPGQISGIQRLPARDVHGGAFGSEPGIWRADITVPWIAANVGHPVLGSGVTGRGNLLLVDVPAPNQVRFDYDQWGIGYSRSNALDVVPGVHRVEIFVGPQVRLQKWPQAWHLDPAEIEKQSSVMKVWWDGALVWTAQVRGNKDSYDLVSLGTNPQGFSTADMIFPNGIKFKPYSREEMREFIVRNLRGEP